MSRTEHIATQRTDFKINKLKKPFFFVFLLKFREPNFAIFTININNESFQLTYNEQKKSALKISIWTLSFRLPLWSSSTLEVFPIELVEEMVLGMMPNHLLLSQPRMHIQPPNSKWPGIQWLVPDTEIVMDQSKMSKPVEQRRKNNNLVSMEFFVWKTLRRFMQILNWIFQWLEIIIKKRIINLITQVKSRHDFRSIQQLKSI